MKILLLGKNGQIGWELQRTLALLGEITALGRQELDLTDQPAIRSAVDRPRSKAGSCLDCIRVPSTIKDFFSNHMPAWYTVSARPNLQYRGLPVSINAAVQR